ncbi:ATP/GTP-binding protein [Streptomyces fructofermentans]|uniref:ATP/GTP-binding protein n=1 Tax=Streptomyces fructofermentans TaxID=152141 RepID=A0A918NU35_9ACTN|nr:ATP/GTP-binding protein [Streptomyces fructofermentans]GGX96513.1 ATP/GTP-binding protein [Streptomyces fructofermentans]
MLSRQIAIAALVVLAASSVPVTTYANEDPKGDGGIECGLYNCTVEVDVPGQAGGGLGGSGGTAGSSGGSGGGSGDAADNEFANACTYKLVDPQPPASSRDWEGHKPGDGAVYEQSCTRTGGELTIVRMVWLADPPAVEAVDPAVLAQRAVDSMTLLGPDVVSPRAAGRYTVGVPMWMWVNRSATTFGPNTASASAGGVTVTATAKVSKIVWEMGDGVSVTCNGPGTQYRPSEGLAQSPTCGHVYSKTSAGARKGKFAVTATSTWAIDWQGGGAAGQLTEVRQTTVQVGIGEVQVVR